MAGKQIQNIIEARNENQEFLKKGKSENKNDEDEIEKLESDEDDE